MNIRTRVEGTEYQNQGLNFTHMTKHFLVYVQILDFPTWNETVT